MATTEALKRAQAKYQKTKVSYTIRLDPEKDAAVIEKLSQVKNKKQYILSLIEKDIR